MSRVGKKPINIPSDVTVFLEDQNLKIKGPKGELGWLIPTEISLEQKEKEILVTPVKENKKSRELWGTVRSVIANMVQGVHEGYEKKLEIEGVGYKAQVSGNNLVLSVGFSHPVEINPPEGVQFSVEKNTITVSGIDKVLVGEVAAKIRSVKKPEPYKGKGIHYEGEFVRRKQGKKAIGAGE